MYIRLLEPWISFIQWKMTNSKTLMIKPVLIDKNQAAKSNFLSSLFPILINEYCASPRQPSPSEF